MTVQDKQELIELHQSSDLLFLQHFLSVCNEEDKEEIEHLIYLNDEVGIGWGEGDYSYEEEQEYFDRKSALTDKYGITEELI